MFQQRLTLVEIQAAWEEVANDAAAGLLVERGGLTQQVLVEAESIALNDTPIVGCRTLDILHVTTAKIMGVTEFCTFDTRQATLAGRFGLVAITP